MKSEDNVFLLGLYQSLLADVADDFPTLRVEFSRDWLRLCSLVENRGIRVFTLDFPEAGKHLEQCLSTETFTKSGLACFRPYRRRGIIPRLFRGLYLRIFDELGMLRLDADAHAIRWLRQLFYTAKKYRMECTPDAVFKTVDDFFDIERSIRSPNLDWEGDLLGGSEDGLERDQLAKLSFCDLRPDHLSSVPDLFDSQTEEPSSRICEGLDLLQNVADIVSSQLGVFQPLEWRTKHGPGATADGKAGRSKYDFPHWPSKLASVFPLDVFAYANYNLWVDSLATESGRGSHFCLHEPPSRLLAVPKTQKGPRLIASEPIAHQWCQQAIKDYFQSRVSTTCLRSSISFRDQRANQRAAERASHDQRSATIDLSSASDRVSCWHVERLFRRNVSLLSALHATRTRWIENTIGGKHPKFHKLRKFSAMGSACTFPVETILFACIVVASVLQCRNLRATIRNIENISREVRVFGDDIVVPSDAGQSCVDLLGHLGFKVNSQKTFLKGFFRESCGLDVYKGVDVTPVYAMTYPRKTRPESVVSCVATHNNFARNYMINTAAYLKSTTQSSVKNSLPIVPYGSERPGLWSMPGDAPVRHPVRWNRNLQRLEHRVTVPEGKVQRYPDRGDSSLLQYFTEAPSPTDKWKAGVVLRASAKLNRSWVAWGAPC
ncbi:RNA-directed RNA polymerase [ssRNA phage SRR5466727_10]|uniref:RNA-directed RNA polymerase n=1 Tax=ssRNA phage SRR5466727_10 TaxID=2786430 RepID=A0A8S5L4U5_9VIRU|nr:RNA-directed RNA polymerase [ssRNA phage SRR5466727_10]DAD52452.1 TPA_asm: RNA-directed RNA polymerase [ssRNA phage SRR5466727_10]